jgi:hypothetical protein
MTHDPICPKAGTATDEACYECGLIARARDDQDQRRDRIAAEVLDDLVFGGKKPRQRWMWQMTASSLTPKP